MATTNPDDFCFTSNLIYTNTKKSTQETFRNKPHLNCDGSPYTFGIWGLMDLQGNLVEDKLNAIIESFFS